MKEITENSVNLSDFRADHTIYLETTPVKGDSKPSQMFQPSEISGRSTTNFENQAKFSKGIEEILASSYSEDAREFYRQSLQNMSLPRTADLSRLSAVSLESNKNRNQEEKKDFWDISMATPQEFDDSRLRNLEDSRNFTPAEQMQQKLQEDELAWEQENADIPMAPPDSHRTSFKENSLVNQSMGQFFQQKSDCLLEMIPKKSPEKRNPRVAMVDVSNTEDSILDGSSPLDRLNFQKLEKALAKLDSPTEFMNRLCGTGKMKPVQLSELSSFGSAANYDKPSVKKKEVAKKSQENSKEYQESKENQDQNLGNSQKSPRKLQNFQKSQKLQEIEAFLAQNSQKSPKSQKNLDSDTITDSMLDSDEISGLNQEFERLSYPSAHKLPHPQIRGLKRRNSQEDKETPKTAISPLKRNRSPTGKIDRREIMAAKLRPPIPAPRNMTPEKSRDGCSDLEYFTAHSSSLPMPESRSLSLPSCCFQPSLSSPTNSLKTGEAASLKRTVSSCSSGSSRSEFEDDSNTLKVTNTRLSWETVKLRKTSTKSLNVKNCSIRKQNLKISVEGAGFKLYSTELMGGVTLSPSEVRSVSVEFCPTVIGPAIGSLLLETNLGIKIKVELYAYGGHASLNVEGIQKGPYGPHFLTMGNLGDLARKRMAEQIITITNSGNLSGFAVLGVDKSHHSDFLLADSISVEPKMLRIKPGETVEVKVKFKPSREEIKGLIQKGSEVLTIGEVFVMSGDEATRLRTMKYSSEVNPKLLKMLPETLPDENNVKKGLANFNEDLRVSLTFFFSRPFSSFFILIFASQF